jgi:hypothetical protein
MARPLLQLPSGTWVDPTTIADIKALDRSADFANIRPRVVVKMGGNGFDISHFDTFAEACEARDELAATINATREAKPAAATPTDGATP